MSVGLKGPTLNRESLALIYTPGVGEVCKYIEANPAAVNTHTNRINMVAVISTGKSLKLKGLSTLPYLEWLCIQLKYFGNLDAFPLVISPEAVLDVVVKDLGNSMAGILSLDEEEPKEVGDVVFASQFNLSRDCLLEAEGVAIVMKERLFKQKYGVVTAKELKEKREVSFYEEGRAMFINRGKDSSRIMSEHTNRENSLFVHEHYRGKIYSHLNFLNWKGLHETVSAKVIEEMAQSIEKEPSLSYALTSRSSLCAIVTDGTAILGLGNIGPRAGLPVMEGKSCLFKSLGNVDVVPICIHPRKTHQEEVVAIQHLIGGFAAVNLEDIAAPQCFEVEEALSLTAGMPIFHDDQHGTAIVALAGLINALELAEKKPEDCKVVINGAGAAGLTITKLMLYHGFKNVLVCDTKGLLDRSRDYSDNKYKLKISEVTNPDNVKGQLADAIKDADVFIGVSAPNAFKHEWVALMAKKAIIFAMANPVPEILPADALKNGAFIAASGRSDFPNQINNSLVFPGIFKGILASGMRQVTDEVKRLTAVAIAKSVPRDKLSTVNIIPESLNADIPNIVSKELCAYKK